MSASCLPFDENKFFELLARIDDFEPNLAICPGESSGGKRRGRRRGRKRQHGGRRVTPEDINTMLWIIIAMLSAYAVSQVKNDETLKIGFEMLTSGQCEGMKERVIEKLGGGNPVCKGWNWLLDQLIMAIAQHRDAQLKLLALATTLYTSVSIARSNVSKLSSLIAGNSFEIPDELLTSEPYLLEAVPNHPAPTPEEEADYYNNSNTGGRRRSRKRYNRRTKTKRNKRHTRKHKRHTRKH